MALSFEIFYKGQPTSRVPEYAEVELVATNRGVVPLENLKFWLGKTCLRQGINLKPGQAFSWNYNVGDLAGELQPGVGLNMPELSQTLEVQPAKLSLAELYRIKTERLPALLSRLAAPNVFRLRYSSEDNRSDLDYFSADATAELLQAILQKLLDGGLLHKLFERLDYQIWDERQRESGFIRGKVRWQPTVQNWLNRPAAAGLAHEWDETKRDYLTLPNLLLVGWLQEIIAELDKLVKLVQQGAPASANLKKSLTDFSSAARTLEGALERRTTLFRPLLAELAAGFTLRSNQNDLQQACQQAANPAYGVFFELWQVYLNRYIALPENEQDSLTGGMLPTSQLYELWVACEIAAALGLHYSSPPGLESASFANANYQLYYNQAAPGGWYSQANRRQPPRPDLRLVTPAGQSILLDVKYRVLAGGTNPADMYRMLAYMNDLAVLSGAIIFPGENNQPALQIIRQPLSPYQRLAELSLRPPAPGENFADWQAQLTARLQEFLNPPKILKTQEIQESS